MKFPWRIGRFLLAVVVMALTTARVFDSRCPRPRRRWSARQPMLTFLVVVAVLVQIHQCSGEMSARRDEGSDEKSSDDAQLPLRPQFDLPHSGNVSTYVGSTAILNCRIEHIGSRKVSWGRGIEIIAGGMMVFADHKRYQPLHIKYSSDWALRIASVKKADEGWYYCQVATALPVSHHLYLHVIVPHVQILGGPQAFINAGSQTNLTCIVSSSQTLSNMHVRWTHNHKLAQFDRSRQGVSVVMQRQKGRTISSLLIERTTDTDSGVYSCETDGVQPASVALVIVNGDQPAAMQTGSQASVEHGWMIVSITLALALV